MLATLLLLLATEQQVPYTEAIEVRLHNVDVIVTDAEGTHVPGLRSEDFEVFEDGVAQRITNFAEYDDQVEARRSRLSTEQGQAGLPVLHALPPPPRKFVLFIDKMNMHPATRRRFARSVSDLIERAMREGDEAMVVRPVSPEKLALDFTGDRAAIREAVAKAMDESRFRTTSPQELEKQQFEIDLGHSSGARGAQRQAARRAAERIRRRVEQRLGNLRAIVAALSDLPGRKVIVTVTESMPSQPGRELFRDKIEVADATFDAPGDFMRADFVDLTPIITEIARGASAHGITIYCLQPEYAKISAPGSVERTSDHTAATAPPVIGVYDALSNTEDTMSLLAEKTGGKWFRGDMRVDDAFRQVTLDVQSYYSLAYSAEGALDRPHRVEVRVRNRPELHVRTRNEVVRRSAPNELTDRVVASLVYPEPSNALAIAVENTGVRREGRAEVAVIDVLVPLSKLTFIRDGDVHRARFTVHYAVTGERTDFVSGIEPEQLVEIPDAEFAAARTKHWRHSVTMTLRRKSTHRIAMGVLDRTSEEWGIATTVVETK